MLEVYKGVYTLKNC